MAVVCRPILARRLVRYSPAMRFLTSSTARLATCLAVTFVVAGCGKSNSKKQANEQPAAKQTPAPAKPAKPLKARPNMGSFDARVQQLNQLADKMCACKDSACAAKVDAELKEWVQTVKDEKISSGAAVAAKGAHARLAGCMAKLAGGKQGQDDAKAHEALLPEGYATKVKAYMADMAAAAAASKDDCNKMAASIGATIAKHKATVELMISQRSNNAVQKWSAAQTAMVEQGRKLGESMQSCARHPELRRILSQLSGK